MSKTIKFVNRAGQVWREHPDGDEQPTIVLIISSSLKKSRDNFIGGMTTHKVVYLSWPDDADPAHEWSDEWFEYTPGEWDTKFKNNPMKRIS